MCGMRQVLALAALYLKLVHSWEIAVSVGDRIEFYTDGTKTDTLNLRSQNPTAIAYDEVHNMILFVDKQSDNEAICGYNLTSTDIRCFIERYGSNIQDLAFDPATDLLFFTDTKKGSINWISLNDQESENNVYGNVLFKFGRIPSDIAVDSCRGYIYWSHESINYYSKYMERARFNGSERKVIYNWSPVYSFVFDPQTHTNYYIDGLESAYYKKVDFRKENLNSEKAEIIYDGNNFPSAPKELTVSNDYLYWMDSSASHTTVWQRPKNASISVKPRAICKFYSEKPLGIAANYKIREQVHGVQDCEALSSLIPTITITNNARNAESDRTTETEQKADSEQTTETGQTKEMEHTAETEHTTKVELTCVHGTKVNETSVCKCKPGYTGERCDVSVCVNFCLEGNLSFNNEWFPKCRCNTICTDQYVVGGTNKTQCATTYAVPHSAAGRGISSPLAYASQVYVSTFIVYIYTLHLTFTK